MSLVRPVGAVLLLLTLVAALSAALASLPAQAATVTVQVRDNAFRPPDIEIVAGDTVQWTWVGQGDHSVTFAGGADSHPECSGAAPENCSDPGDAPYVRTFPEPGEFSYVCRIHGVSDGMNGIVRVQANQDPASPTPSETGPALPTQPEPSPTESDPEPEPTRPEPEPTPSAPPTTSDPTEPTPTEAPPPPPPSSEPAPEPPPPTTAPSQLSPRPLPSVSPSPRRSPTDPDFAPFPSARPDADPTDDPADDEVAVPLPDGDGPDRSVLLAIASVAVLGSATTFGALVLFGPPWMGV